MEAQSNDDDNLRTIEIGGDCLATFTFLQAREEQQAQIVIDTCCDSFSIFDERKVQNLIGEMSLWLTRKRRQETLDTPAPPV